MQRIELIDFLKSHQLGVLDTEFLRRERNPDIVYVDNKPVFLFSKSFDINDSPIDESISVSQQPYQTDIPLHMHNYIEMMYVYRGECTVTIGGMDRLLRTGDIIIIDKDTPHAVRQTGIQDIVINIIMKQDFLSPAFLGRLTKQSIISQFMIESLINNRRHNHFLIFSSGGMDKIEETMENIMCEFFDRDLLSTGLIDSFLIVLFSLLIRYNKPKETVYASHQDRQHFSLVDILKYIEEHYEDCNLIDMGALFGFHPNYLSALLKKGTGKSFKQLLQIQRISQAALFLSNSTLSIPEIAERVGYSSLTFFYKKFKELFHATPHEYREMNRRY